METRGRQDVSEWAGRSQGQQDIRKEPCVGDMGEWPGTRWCEVRKEFSVGIGANSRGRDATMKSGGR